MPKNEKYTEVLKTAEFALVRGEYSFCIEYLYPKIESYSLSSKEGVDLRTIIITCLLYTSPSPRDRG